MLLTACSKAKPENLPEDNPCNHIRSHSIMETENGYYTNLGYRGELRGNSGEINFVAGISLKFIERDTDKEVYLCARPECMHNGGEMCTATYKNLHSLNSVLYGGAIYTLVVEDINESVSYSVYRSALDGSSITRVGSVFSVNNIKNEEYRSGYMSDGNELIIHKGYAYVLYHLSLGDNVYSGFAGSGLARMNLSDGSSEILYSGENYYAEYPHNLQGSGDYVYYDIGRGDRTVYAYNINDGTTEKVDFFTSRYPYIAGERVFVMYSYNLMEDWDYTWTPHDICTVDKETGRVTNLVHIDEPTEHGEAALPYKDTVIVLLDSGVYVYSETGELLAEAESLNLESEALNLSEQRVCSAAISEDKLYLYETTAFDDWKYYFYSCPIEDILAGGGEWKFEYSLNM